MVKRFENRFEIIKPLKESLTSSTYLGTDLEKRTPVVIKTVSRKTAAPAMEMLLAQEAQALQTMGAVSPAFPIHLGSDRDTFFVVLPFVEGQTLRERLGTGPLPWMDVLNLGAELLTALERAHDHGILHRDIKPENIVLTEKGVALIDFGFALTDRAAGQMQDNLGTPLYLSPEQGGLIDSEVDARSDLYSVGAVLFECLAGVPPFLGDTVGEVLRKHLTETPPDIHRYQPATPRSLVNIVLHFLEKEPTNRYQTARAAKEDLLFVRSGWEKTQEDPNLIVGFTDRRSALALPAFVGRVNELRALETLLAKAAQGNGGIGFIEAESGGGKSRLLSEFVQTIHRDQVLVLNGQGVDQVARRPYQLLMGVANDLVNEIERRPEIARALSSSLQENAQTLVAVLPSLKKVFPTAEQGALGPEHLGESRSLLALSEFLSHLGTREKPALLILDDCQWADVLTLKLLSVWQQETEHDRKHVLILAAFRTEEVPATHALRGLQPIQSLYLKHLDRRGTEALLQSMAGKLPTPVIDMVFELSQGSPFMASAVLRGLVECNALTYDGNEWVFQSSSLAGIQSSRHAATVLARRFHILPAPLLTLLKVAAILGKEFDIRFLSELSKVSVDETERLLRDAQERHILWSESGGRYVFVHDKLRETLLGLIEEKERVSLHRFIAQTLKERHPEKDFEIAYHFDAAGEPRLALPSAMRSADAARAQHSLEIAEIQFRIAERGLDPSDTPTARRIAESLGDVLMLRGKYEAAAEYLKRATQLAASAYETATIEVKLGELFFKQGNLKAAAEALETGLRRIGHPMPRTTFGFFWRAVGEAFVQALHTLFPKLFVGRIPAHGRDRDLLVIRMLSRVTYTYWFASGRIPCLYSHLRSLNLAERLTQTPELAQAYSEHAPVATLVGWFSRGEKYVARSLAIRQEANDVWGQGQSLNFYGVVLYASSRYREAIDKCREAARILNRTGDLWEMNTAEWHIAYCHYRLGELTRAIEVAQRVYQQALRIGDVHAIGISLAAWSKASGGRIPSEFIGDRVRKIDPGDIHTTVEVLQADGIRLLGEHRYDEAAKRFQDGCALVSRSGLYTEYMVPAFSWWTTALRMRLEYLKPYETEVRAKLMREAIRVSDLALSLSRRFANNLPHALRERALLEAMRGRRSRTRSLLDKSLELSRKQGAQYETARTLFVRARLSNESPVAQVSALRELGANLTLEDPTLANIDAQDVTISLIDRFDAILQVGRKIVASLSRREIYQAIADAFVSLLRAEECTLVQLTEVDGQKAVKILHGEPREISLSLLQQTMDKGVPVVFFGDRALQPSDSMVLSGTQSAMCVPIYVRGRIELFAHLTHHRVQRLFGVEEERIADFIRALAGASLENVAGYENLQENSERLTRSNAELERYAYLASHDLQEPLRHLVLTSQLLEESMVGTHDGEKLEYLKEIILAAKRMRTMVVDMLQYARIDPADEDFEAISLVDTVRAAITNLQEGIRESGATISYGALPMVRAHRTQLVSLFQNLLSNAIKFRSDRTPEISIAAQEQNGRCVVQISDNGIGFEPKFAETIFEAFRRIHSQDDYPGTGIGLAACQKIVARHGGRIWATSTPGKGSTFSFTLPLES